MKQLVLLTMFFLQGWLRAQPPLRFAHVSDTHIGSSDADEDLRRTVQRINADPTLSFVILSGDITDFGSDAELLLARQILDSLQKPWYIVPGNHDANWSESGTNSFKKIFGAETFQFEANGFLFLGTACGPNMRMSPGQVPRENIRWLDSSLRNMKDPQMPVIFVNHYPIDTALNNWYDVIDLLKTRNTQLILCGHGHSNHKLRFEGIPAVMGRSNLRAKQPAGGYNVVTIANGAVTYEETNSLTGEQTKWAELPVGPLRFKADTTRYFRPSYAVNRQYPQVKPLWQFNDNSDIGSGTKTSGNLLIATNAGGQIYALNKETGKKVWQYQTGGKIWAVPAVAGGLVVAGSSDQFVYCLNAANGRLVWKVAAGMPVLAEALINQGIVYAGSSDHRFRAIHLRSGQVKWSFDSVQGFVVSRPLLYRNKIYFGDWGTWFYALDAATGALAWKWNNGSANRMYSPAACYPAGANGRVFIVAPDRFMTVFDAGDGRVVWRKQDPAYRVRESMGLSADSALVFAKTMEGELIGVSTSAPDMQIPWRSDTHLNYEIGPTAIVEQGNIVYVPSNSGVVTAVNRADGKVLWKHKVSNCLITSITPIAANKVVATTMDGKVVCLQF